MAPLDTTEGFDFEGLKRDLTELTEAYNVAAEKKNHRECEIIFERLLELGSSAISSTSKEDESKVKDIVSSLPNAGAKQLYMLMLGYGLNKAFGGLVTRPELDDEEPFDEESFRPELISIATRTKALTEISDDPEEEERTMEEFMRIAKEIAHLPNHQIERVVDIAENCFAEVEEPLTEGPNALRPAGKRSHLYFARMVRKFQMEARDKKRSESS